MNTRLPAGGQAGRVHHGFTLLELMVVLALIALMATLAIPSFQRMVAKAALASMANDFATAAMQARSEAIRASRRAYVVPASGSSWTGGWIVFVDLNANGTYDAGTDTLITSNQSFDTRLTTDTVTSTSVGFDATGFPIGLASSCVAFQLASNPWGENARQVVLASSGRVRVVQAAPGSACPTS